MNDRMSLEMEKTVDSLRFSMPKKRQRSSMPLLLRIVLSETSPALLIAVLTAVLICGYVFTELFTIPASIVFFASPVPLLIFLHSYILRCNDEMRELEYTFRYSYGEMLLARSLVISVYTALSLLFLCLTVHEVSGTSFIRLLLCGALPNVYLFSVLLLIASKVRDTESLSFISSALWLSTLVLALSFDVNDWLLEASAVLLTVLLFVGACTCVIAIFRFLRREKYATYTL
ncbi:MAG: hypothetical protein IJO81_01375 [Clostridia bacterium]|nr:hypothetical protein [Clostridia bacterium]